MANCEAIYIDSRLGIVQCHDTEFHKGEHRPDEMISVSMHPSKGKNAMADLGKKQTSLKQRLRQAINDLRAKGELLGAEAVWDLWDFHTELVVENEYLQEQVKELRAQLEEKKKPVMRGSGRTTQTTEDDADGCVPCDELQRELEGQ